MGLMTHLQEHLKNKLVITAALISAITSATYACASMGPHTTYSFCRAIAFVGLPGILAAAALTIGLLGSHGGGPLGMLLVIATPVNFFFYLAIGLAAKRLAGLVKRKAG